MDVQIAPSWQPHLAPEFEKPYFHQLADFVKKAYQSGTVYPPPKEIFRAFELCSFEATKVVIIGQDPYHGPNQANGLCFSVREDVPMPPSLRNIFKEIQSDLGIAPPQHGNLERWARQGILLLNATLTVASGSPGTHQNKGWETFTDAVIRCISEQKKHVVFLLWGNYAQRKGSIVDHDKHLVLTAAHPSPFSADKGFFGNRHFSQTNDYLYATQEQRIQW